MSSLQQECTHLFTLSLSLSQLVSRGGFVCDVIDTFENPKIHQKRDQSTGVQYTRMGRNMFVLHL